MIFLFPRWEYVSSLQVLQTARHCLQGRQLTPRHHPVFERSVKRRRRWEYGGTMRKWSERITDAMNVWVFYNWIFWAMPVWIFIVHRSYQYWVSWPLDFGPTLVHSTHTNPLQQYCSMVFCLRMFTYRMSKLCYPRYSQMVMYSSNSFNDWSRSEGLPTGFLGLNCLWCMFASEWNPNRDHQGELTLVGCCTLQGFGIETTRI